MATAERTATQAKAGKNQSLFREVNERIEELAGGSLTARLEIICECADDTCAQLIKTTNREYEDVRADGTRFLVAPDHVVLEAERVTEQRPTYWIVEKIEQAAVIAESLSPREGS